MTFHCITCTNVPVTRHAYSSFRYQSTTVADPEFSPGERFPKSKIGKECFKTQYFVKHKNTLFLGF